MYAATLNQLSDRRIDRRLISDSHTSACDTCAPQVTYAVYVFRLPCDVDCVRELERPLGAEEGLAGKLGTTRVLTVVPTPCKCNHHRTWMAIGVQNS
jgi:hypothetical protein